MKTIHVCVGSACHLKGAYQVVNRLQKIVEEKKLEDYFIIKAAFCLGNCTNAVSVKVDEGAVVSLTEKEVEAFLEKLL
ncbi:(2Fe-2S) ferredoxin domain-containing protein [Isachenkonia alkalipeptolytica]|uniref:(2Fe-2S) ferredoxin domain-containing protein n=1 Tax=Isachenkonia alkalipeptolytica TaxID=2565777 RepID=A0AA43XP87_9CLOT|nr:NAD(P)H-dependent oxidoreductase subunit E [Isachenkonia alkalipeptolytica]NBG89285.1 (2Fe-2S) ferredoxin domain-containing protein [Isachenkonia alkalipeptolytica]